MSKEPTTESPPEKGVVDSISIENTEKDDNEGERETPAYDVISYPVDNTLQVYLQQHRDGILVIPKFQRQFVWGVVKASRLIESFMLGLPIPPVFMQRRKKGGTYELVVIDGQQRITSVVSFLGGKFPSGRKFALFGIAARYKGKTFDDLNDDEKQNLNNAVLRCMVIDERSANPEILDAATYDIFERLNTSGVNLNPMEVRRCVSRGKFMSALEEINEDENWNAILGKRKDNNGKFIHDIRYRDVELILRVLSLHKNLENYAKPMKRFMDKYATSMCKAERENGPSFEKHLSEIKGKFCKVSRKIAEHLGEKPFHLRNPINVAALDSVMYTALQTDDFSGYKEGYEKLKKDPKFEEYTTIGTSDPKTLKQRIDLTKSYLIKG